MKRKLLLAIATVALVVGGVVGLSAYEAYVINVTAHIENALRVHPIGPFDYNTVFPQEYFSGAGFNVGTSDSFSAPTQKRVQNIEYVIKQKPKPKPAYISQVGFDEASRWCRENNPADINNPNDPYYANCYPNMCPYISKTPQNQEPGDVGVSSFHDPLTQWAVGKLYKQITPTDPKPMDVDDFWILDLSVPCFKGQCAQDWTHPGWELPAGLESQTFGCDLWIEVTSIY